MKNIAKRMLCILLAAVMCTALQPVSAQNLALPVGSMPTETYEALPEKAAMEREIELADEDEGYMLNIVLFALRSAVALEKLEPTLEAMGISRIEPLFTENGEAAGIGKKNEVWYRAYTVQDVNETVAQMMENKDIVYAEPEYIYHAESYGEPNAAEKGASWAYDKLMMSGDQYWWNSVFEYDSAPGSGTVVAVIDSGVDYTHEDLASSMWVNTAELYGTEGVDDDGNGYIDDIYGVDVTASGKKAGNPMDDQGHGTHVAGIIGMAANGQGGVGLAYGAKIMAIKAGYSTGSLASSYIAKGIKYAHMMGADVINMSFGGTAQSYLIESALEDAFGQCVLVASAGNNGLPTTDAPSAEYKKKEDVYPAAYPYVIGVMATDERGNLASFSNWDYIPGKNAEYELTAPGKEIYSTLPGNRYAKWSGTSMAAPCVSAAAAILRSHFNDREKYSSRFLMGQLASATRDNTVFIAPKGEDYQYPALNVFDSAQYLPKPNLSVKQTFLLDNVGNGNVNDGDGIIDAGEVIDMGILLRNQWGQTGDITVRADAISAGGVANPYVEFITDTITLQPAGTFEEQNNGFVYDDSLLNDISNPIRFRISPDTPNNTEICINLTVTTTNGVDDKDTEVYSIQATHTFRVQAGRGIKGTLTEDTTLTNDYLWVVENTLYIPEGVTLTIEPGTKVQFYSSDYEGAYGGLTMPGIVNDGVLNAVGTEEEPIELYPGAGYEQYCVDISGNGVETLKYCYISNPGFFRGFSFTAGLNLMRAIDTVDHCVLTQTFSEICYRSLNGSKVEDYVRPYCDMYISTLINSRLENITNSSVNPKSVWVKNISNCQFDSCNIILSTSSRKDIQNSKYNVFINNGMYKTETRLSGYTLLPVKTLPNIEKSIYHYGNSKYIIMNDIPSYVDIKLNANYHIAKAYAATAGGTLLCLNSTEEEAFIAETLRQRLEETRKEGNTDSIYGYYYVDYTYDNDTGNWIWADGSEYVSAKQNLSNSSLCGLLKIDSRPNKFYQEIYGDGIVGGISKAILEFPDSMSDEEILNKLENMDFYAWLTGYARRQGSNAILNPVFNNDPNTWSVYTAPAYSGDVVYYDLSGNYWGTENKTLIDKMIIDADDFAGQLADIREEPILTLDSPSLQDIYPFVTQVYLTDGDGNIVSSASTGSEYSVHVKFNRDMDMDIQPMVSYGPDTPYTDYVVDGAFVSPREWVGKTRISYAMTNGTMYWRTKGGCAADDKWLVCGEDTLRFRFTVSTTGVLAMMLNATGGANKVELSWAQNDYETLAGYNLYRSEQSDGTFQKINLSLVTDLEYTDMDVRPGVTYYYYFKVVNTDGVEENSVSNTASAAPIDNIFPVLRHTPVTTARAGSGITISATATDNIGVTAVKLYYKKPGEQEFRVKEMTVGDDAGNLYVGVIPAADVTADGLVYYVTAQDADGNISYSGTALVPNRIAVDGSAYISGITPSKVSASGGATVAVLGSGFSEDMVLKVGGETVTECSFINSGQINFIAPAKASGSYAVTLTGTDGKAVTSAVRLSYTDETSIAQIPTTMRMVSGVPYTIPFYAASKGEVISIHAELDLPAADFTNVKVEKVDADAAFQLDYTYKNGVLKIGCISSSAINTGDDALLHIVVTPQVNADKQYTIRLHDVAFNDVAVSTVISGEVILKPSYSIRALVRYFMGDSVLVPDVTISAAGVTGTTDTTGTVSLTVSDSKVTAAAFKGAAANAVTAYDASLVLQHAVGKTTLTDMQQLAADVDQSGTISEYDAALILQRAVRKLDAFPGGSEWVFVPPYQDITLTSAVQNNISFTAIAVGDVDGSYRGDTQ